MAISTTRVKFLDKENKILVKPIKDFVSNDIFSDFVTSFLDTDLVSSFLSQQSLLNLQSGIGSLSTFLTDSVVSNFSVNSLLNGINFNTPELSHLATTINAIKSMDDKTVSLFVSSLLEVVTDKLVENPSLVNLYQSVGSDAKTQTLLSALDVFATKLSSGQITAAAFTAELKQAGGDDFNLAKLNTLLAAVKSNTKTVNLTSVIAGSASLATSFLAGLTALEVKEEEVASGVAGVSGLADVSGTSVTPADVDNLKLTDPDIQNILLVYLTVKQTYVLAHLRSTSSVYTPASFLSYVQTPAGSYYLTAKLTGQLKVCPGVQANILVKALYSLFIHISVDSTAGVALSLAQLTELFKTITSTINSGLDSLLSDTKASIDTSFSPITPVANAVNFINDVLGERLIAGFEGFIAKPEITALVAHVKLLTNTRIVAYLSLTNATRDANGIGGVIAYTSLQMIKYLISVTNQNLNSYYALVNVVKNLATSIFSFTADLEVAKKGFSLNEPIIAEDSLTGHVGVMPKLYSVINKSKVTTAAITTIPEVERALYQSLKDFNVNLKTAIGEPAATVDYDSDANLAKIYELYKASTSALDNVKFASKALYMDQIAFSTGLDSVTIL